MHKLIIPQTEKYDEAKGEFVTSKERVLQLEHSLVSISKWESKWHKAFLSNQQKTVEEFIDYIRCMTLTQNVPPEVYECIGREQIREVSKYMEEPMTATTISKERKFGPKKKLTAEVIYSYMIALGIPFECQKWHINRLLMLIDVCGIQRRPPKRVGKGEGARRRAALNASRRKRLHSNG